MAGKSLLILVILEILKVCSGKLPSIVQVCSRNDPNIDECIKNSVNKLKPYLGTGNLGDGFVVPALEPFSYEGFSINPSPSFLVKVKNASVIGASNFTIEKLRFNYNKIVLDMITLFPNLTMLGIYDMKAKISILDINGQGDLKASIVNTKMKIKITGSRYNSNNQTFIKYDKVTIKFQIGKTKVYLTNLFNGDPTLQAVGNQLVNENQDIFFEYIIPVLEKQFAKLFKDVGDAIVEKATVDELFPDT
ncbi:protein takeout-like [Chironomus tepperi]|uniref:protein takeout-like n=1 Tax=Chironomus tepperi TaxID=113505 RepID=UPI00391FA973